MADMDYSLLPPNSGPMPVQIAETDVNPVVAGGDKFGWVSGNAAGLAPLGTVKVIFDLGPLWYRYPIAAICVNPDVAVPGGLSSVSFTGSDTPVQNSSRRLKDAVSAGLTSMGSGLGQYAQSQCFVRPVGRYLIIQITNGDTTNAQATLKITLSAYPS